MEGFNRPTEQDIGLGLTCPIYGVHFIRKTKPLGGKIFFPEGLISLSGVRPDPGHCLTKVNWTTSQEKLYGDSSTPPHTQNGDAFTSPRRRFVPVVCAYDADGQLRPCGDNLPAGASSPALVLPAPGRGGSVRLFPGADGLL